MAKGTYTYEPVNIMNAGLDKMRFELGDTMVEGGADTCALTDEEIIAALETFPQNWKKAKLMLLESICRRFAFEVDTKEGPLSFSFSERAKLWREDYEKLKKEVSLESMSVFSSAAATGKSHTRPYFYTGMLRNPRAGGQNE